MRLWDELVCEVLSRTSLLYHSLEINQSLNRLWEVGETPFELLGYSLKVFIFWRGNLLIQSINWAQAAQLISLKTLFKPYRMLWLVVVCNRITWFVAYSCSQCGPEILLLSVSVLLNLCVIECYAFPNFCVSANSTITIDVGISEFR